MGEIEHGGHRQGEGPHPEGQGTQQAEEEGLDLNPVSHRSREQYPAEHSIDQQGQESQHKTNPCGGDQLAQIDAPAGQAERDFILQGIILILIGKDLVRHDHRQIEAHREKGGQQGQAISEAALKHVTEAEPPQEGQPGGQGQQDQQECPEIRAGHRPAPFRGQVVLHALPSLPDLFPAEGQQAHCRGCRQPRQPGGPAQAHVVPLKGHVFQILQHDPRHKLPQHLKCRVEQDSKRL